MLYETCLKWFTFGCCITLAVGALYPFVWFLLPKPQYRRASSKRRPADPDEGAADLRFHRYIWFAVIQFFFFICLVLVMGTAGDSHWRVQEQELDVLLEDPAAPASASLPPITISADGEVVFMELRLPPENRRLIELSEALRELLPSSKQTEPVVIQPDAESTHQRVIEVLDAVERVRSHRPVLLSQRSLHSRRPMSGGFPTFSQAC
jgi:biopolymer transport protein ExbD